MSKISLASISDLITKGTTPTTIGAGFTNNGVNYLKSESISTGKHVNSSIFEHISVETHERLKRSQLKENDLVVSIAGAYLGKMAIIQKSDLPLNTNQAVGIVRLDQNRCLSEFAYYYLMQPQITEYINKLSSQSSQPNLNLELLGSLEIEDIHVDVQRGRIYILSLIDELIENNESICTDLEAMAKLLYDYWFVQFDYPNDNGKPYKSSGGKMVWNEQLKREIPEGWYISNLEPFIKVIRGVSYNPDMISETPQDGYVPLVKSNNVQNDRLMLDDVIFVPQSIVSNDQYLTDNSIFVTMSNGSTEHVGKTAIITFDTPYCFGAFCSKIMVNPEYRCFVSLFFLSEYFKKHIRSIIVGTSIKNINNNHLIDNVIPIPPEHVLQRFESIINPLFDKQGSIIQENQQLKSLRDFLLPMLMNGQVTVKD